MIKLTCSNNQKRRFNYSHYHTIQGAYLARCRITTCYVSGLDKIIFSLNETRGKLLTDILVISINTSQYIKTMQSSVHMIQEKNWFQIISVKTGTLCLGKQTICTEHSQKSCLSMNLLANRQLEAVIIYRVMDCYHFSGPPLCNPKNSDSHFFQHIAVAIMHSKK